MSPPLVTLHPLTSFFVGSLVSSVVLFLLKFCQFIFNHLAIYWPLISRFLFCHFQWISVLIYIFSPLFLDGFCELTGDQHSQLHWPFIFASVTHELSWNSLPIFSNISCSLTTSVISSHFHFSCWTWFLSLWGLPVSAHLPIFPFIISAPHSLPSL